MKNKRLWILPGGIVLIGIAFLLLNFRVAVSNTQTIPRMNVTDIQGNYPDRLGANDKISLVLVGDGPLVPALRKALTEQWGKVGMGQFELEQEFRSTYPNPVLFVKVGKPGLVWTPFFAMSQFFIITGYATNGDTTFTEGLDKNEPIRNPDPMVVNMYFEYEGSDRSFGLISRPGYHQYLADYFAKQIVEAMKNLYNIQDPGGG